MLFRRRGSSGVPAEPWGAGRLYAAGAGIGVCVLLLLTGLVLGVLSALSGHHHQVPAGVSTRPGAGADATATGATAVSGYDRAAAGALAARPMPVLPDAAFQPHAFSTRTPPVLRVPAPTRTGPDGVPSGFPRTPAGALAQMAAIDQAALQSKTLAGARAVLAGWVLPGGPAAGSWSRLVALRQIMDGNSLTDGDAAKWALQFTPVMGLIKGSVGAGFVVPCVDYELDGTVAATSRVAVGACARMVWQGGRWMIGPGAEPVPAPSAWPDTDEALNAGYADLVRG